MPTQPLPFPQGAAPLAQNTQVPVAGIVPQAGPPPTPNPLQEIAGVQGGAPQGVPDAGNLTQLQGFFQKIGDPKVRLNLATILGQSVPAPDEAELQEQLPQLLQSFGQQGGA